MIKINNGSGTLGRLIQDTVLGDYINSAIMDIKKSAKGLNENMQAVKHNFLLKGYFNKKTKAVDKSKKEAADKKVKEQKVIDKKK